MTYRLAELSDAKLYFDWANDPDVRMNAHNTNPILWENHVKWFKSRLESDTFMLVFFDGLEPVGQIRVENGAIDLSVDPKHRRKGIATEMLLVLKAFQKKNINMIQGEVKQSNIPSNKAFERAGFKLESVVNVNGVDCNVFKV